MTIEQRAKEFCESKPWWMMVDRELGKRVSQAAIRTTSRFCESQLTEQQAVLRELVEAAISFGTAAALVASTTRVTPGPFVTERYETALAKAQELLKSEVEG